MKKILALLTLCSTLALADIPKIFSVEKYDPDSIVSVTIDIPADGFLIISYHVERLGLPTKCYINEQVVRLLNSDDTYSQTTTVLWPVEPEEITLKMRGGQRIHGWTTKGVDIQALYIPQRQETSSIEENPDISFSTIFPQGAITSDINGYMYNATGERIKKVSIGEKISIQSLSKGTYYIKGKTSQSTKIIIP